VRLFLVCMGCMVPAVPQGRLPRRSDAAAAAAAGVDEPAPQANRDGGGCMAFMGLEPLEGAPNSQRPEFNLRWGSYTSAPFAPFAAAAAAALGIQRREMAPPAAPAILPLPAAGLVPGEDLHKERHPAGWWEVKVANAGEGYLCRITLESVMDVPPGVLFSIFT
jgi:hypothetical protein